MSAPVPENLMQAKDESRDLWVARGLAHKFSDCNANPVKRRYQDPERIAWDNKLARGGATTPWYCESALRHR
jgi:hypothetical protein